MKTADVGLKAVVDKDLAPAVLPLGVREKLFIMLTDADSAYMDFSSKNPKPIREIRLPDLERQSEQGYFPPGGMSPKVEAAMMFLKNGGERVYITSPGKLEAALRGEAGTLVLP